jgi:mitogen-activated protein kinase kinase
MASPAPVGAAATSPIVRKKRNFKNLELPSAVLPKPASQAPPMVETTASATRLAPAAPGGGRKKPPAMDLTKSKTREAPKQKSSPGLLVVASATSAPPSASSASAARSNYQQLTDTLASLDMSSDRLDLKMEDLKNISELGSGNGGTVSKVEHIPTGTIMAKKLVLIDAKPAVRKQILRELQIMHDCHSKYIISFYGAFVHDPHICICMEHMDKGSLDNVYKKSGPIPIDVVAQIALAVLEGLTYLYDVHRIIHRDIKPSNILLNSKGEIKICDFGVSGELINSIADTFVGTSTYMSPERIQGAQYTVKSDVWSMGIALIELALGRFPFADSDSSDSDLSDLEGTLSPYNMRHSAAMDLSRTATFDASPVPLPPKRKKEKPPTSKKDKRKSRGVSLQGGGMTMSILELLQHIVNEPAPRLTPEGKFPKMAEDFVDKCLLKDPDARPTPKELLKEEWIKNARTMVIDLESWAATI